MAGKNKITRWTRVYLGGYDISGTVRNVGSLDNGFEEIDFTGFSQTVKNFLAGHRMVGIRDFQALIDDTAGQSVTAMQNSPATRVSFVIGDGAAPAIGDLAYLLGHVQMGDNVTWDASAGVITASFLPSAAQTTIVNPFGVALHPATSLSATTNASSVDNGASSANGGHANLHITATSSGNFTYKVQHSTNDADWSDLITFTADGSTVTSEQQTITGTINQYLRFQATRTGGSATPVCTFARD